MYTPEENKILDNIGVQFLVILAKNSLEYGAELTVTAMSEIFAKACYTLRLPKELVIANISSMMDKLYGQTKESDDKFNETDPNLN